MHAIITFLQLYEHCKCNYASDTHGQVHVHADMAYKFNHYMHACIITLKHCHIVAVGMTLLQLPNSLSSIYIIESVVCAKNVVYPEALYTLTHCGHRHDLTSVAQLSVINITDIRSAFDKTLSSEHFRRNAVDDAP